MHLNPYRRQRITRFLANESGFPDMYVNVANASFRVIEKFYEITEHICANMTEESLRAMTLGYLSEVEISTTVKIAELYSRGDLLDQIVTLQGPNGVLFNRKYFSMKGLAAAESMCFDRKYGPEEWESLADKLIPPNPQISCAAGKMRNAVQRELSIHMPSILHIILTAFVPNSMASIRLESGVPSIYDMPDVHTLPTRYAMGDDHHIAEVIMDEKLVFQYQSREDMAQVKHLLKTRDIDVNDWLDISRRSIGEGNLLTLTDKVVLRRLCKMAELSRDAALISKAHEIIDLFVDFVVVYHSLRLSTTELVQVISRTCNIIGAREFKLSNPSSMYGFEALVACIK